MKQEVLRKTDSGYSMAWEEAGEYLEVAVEDNEASKAISIVEDAIACGCGHIVIAHNR